VKKILYLLLLICFSLLPVIAADWVQIPDTTTYFNKESIKNEGKNIYSIETKSPADNGLEYRNIFVINGNTQKFNISEIKLFDPKNQKVIKRKKYYDWYDMRSGSNISDLYQVILILTNPQVKTKDAVIHSTLEINPNIELLMAHEYYKGIKVKSIKIKQVEIKKDNYIINSEVIEGEPNCMVIIVEITDMKGNTIGLLGMQSLSKGDYTFKIEE